MVRLLSFLNHEEGGHYATHVRRSADVRYPRSAGRCHTRHTALGPCRGPGLCGYWATSYCRACASRGRRRTASRRILCARGGGFASGGV